MGIALLIIAYCLFYLYMFAIDVIPLAFLPRNDDQILSYYHPDFLKSGSVIEVPLGRRKTKAVVLLSEPLKSRKLAFKKTADFELKSVARVIESEPKVADWQFKIAAHLSDYYYAPMGLSLKTILPGFWGKRGYKIEVKNTENAGLPAMVGLSAAAGRPAISFAASSLRDHFQNLRQPIEDYISRDHQVFILVPEKSMTNYFADKFSYFSPVVITGNISNKEHYRIWQEVSSGQVKLIIGTRIGLFLPFSNLGLIIADDEANEAYKSDMTPRYFAPDLAAEISRIHGAKILLTSNFPRLETYYLKSPELPKAAIKKPLIINMADELKSGNFSIFSRDLKELIRRQAVENQPLMVYVPRRGHANFILCQNCGQSLKCPECEAILTLHKQPRESLICHHCGYTREKPKNCPDCQAYKLKPFGVGIEKVAEELKKFFKRENIQEPLLLILDADRAKTETQELEILKDFKTDQFSILLTTQKIFSYKYSISLPRIAVVGADALINIPEFRAEESFLRQLLTLGQMSDNILIQTYNPRGPALKALADENITGFLEQELENRRLLKYPPFSKLIKLSFLHKDRTRAANEAGFVRQKLDRELTIRKWGRDFEILGPAPAFIPRDRGRYVWNLVIKVLTPEIKKRNWLLRFVSSDWIINVDPKAII